MKIIWLVLVFVCGAILPVQGGLNARLGKSIGSPVYASLISFVVGSLSVGIYVLFNRETITWTSMKSAPLISWLGGGIAGAIFITATMMALPRLGMALTFGLIVAGQMTVAVLFDHFNILVAQQHAISMWRITGVVLILAGVFVLQKY